MTKAELVDKVAATIWGLNKIVSTARLKSDILVAIASASGRVEGARVLESLELLLFGLLFPILTVASVLLAPPTLTSYLPAFLLLVLLVLTIALDAAELITAALLPPMDLPKLASLPREPRVALLVLVRDDFLPAIVPSLLGQSSTPSDIFILDDSTENATQRVIDRLPFRVLRRGHHRGHKAGNINNWLHTHGAAYDYFLVLDSDSIIPTDFVRHILFYAEHPDNSRIAIFNTLRACHNRTIPFAKIMSSMYPLRNWLALRSSNNQQTIFSYGHNNLHRTSALLEVGGFPESFLAEDFAVTIELARSGYASKLVNLYASEAEPPNIVSYVTRLVRWAKQTVQLHRIDFHRVPLTLRFQLFKTTCSYWSHLCCVAGATVAAWASLSSVSDLRALLLSIWHLDHRLVHLLHPLIFLSVIGLLPFALRLPFLRAARVRIRDYALHTLTASLVVLYAMVPVTKAQLLALISRDLVFEVTRKAPQRILLSSVVFFDTTTLLWGAVLLIGFSRNPVAATLSLPWLAAWLTAPAILWRVSCASPRNRRAETRGEPPSEGTC